LDKIRISRAEKLFKRLYKTNRSLFLQGRTGSGKSQLIKKFGVDTAKDIGSEFFDWNNATKLEKLDAIGSDKFIFVDFKISTLADPSDLRGIISLTADEEWADWKMPLPFLALAMSKVRGILFFDEVNLAPPSLQASIYDVMLNGVIGDRKLNCWVCSAGNVTEDQAGIFKLSKPLTNRVCMKELELPDFESEWIPWALSHNIDDRIISYYMKNTDKFTNYGPKEEKWTTPRSHELLSDTIKGVEDYELIKELSEGYYTEGEGYQFVAFCKLAKNIDLNSIFEHPELALNLQLDEQYMMVSMISTWFNKHKTEKDFRKVLDLWKVLIDRTPELPRLSCSLIRRVDEQRCTKNLAGLLSLDEYKVLAEQMSDLTYGD
jgi:hypothetical protein